MKGDQNLDRHPRTVAYSRSISPRAAPSISKTFDFFLILYQIINKQTNPQKKAIKQKTGEAISWRKKRKLADDVKRSAWEKKEKTGGTRDKQMDRKRLLYVYTRLTVSEDDNGLELDWKQGIYM
jgi:hypothetical protein